MWFFFFTSAWATTWLHLQEAMQCGPWETVPFPTLGDDDDDDDFIILRSRNHSAPMLALQVGAHQTWGHYMDLMGGGVELPTPPVMWGLLDNLLHHSKWLSLKVGSDQTTQASWGGWGRKKHKFKAQLQSEFKANMINLVRPCSKKIKARKWWGLDQG